MLRRQTRLRKEYLYRKSLEGKEREEYERRRAVRLALADGKALPTEFAGSTIDLERADAYADPDHDLPRTHQDDEYAQAGVIDPKVVVTTSRDPSARLKQFVKEVRLLVPNAQRLNRGNLVVGDLVEACKANDVTDIVVLHEHRGQPDALIVSHLPFGPTAFFNLSNVVMRHDLTDENLPNVSEAYPHLVFHQFNSALAHRTQNILKYLFPVPKLDSLRVMTFSNANDYISFRHHVFRKDGRRLDDIHLTEVGPRFEMKLFQIKLGTMDQAEADDEWVLRPHMNTAKKRKALG